MFFMKLADLIAPLDEAEFSRRYWDKLPVVVHRDAVDHFKASRFLRRVQSALFIENHKNMDVELVRIGGAVGNTKASEKEGLKSRTCNGPQDAARAYDEGFTVRISDAQKHFHFVRQIVHSVESEFAVRVGANIYISPPGKRGFGTHYDRHDVVALQLLGEKLWNVFGRAERDADIAAESDDGLIAGGRPAIQETLAAGDTIYLPQGFWHNALAAAGPSVHLTLSLQAPTWGEVFKGRVPSLAKRPGALPLRLLRRIPPNQNDLSSEISRLLKSKDGEAEARDILANLLIPRRKSRSLMRPNKKTSVLQPIVTDTSLCKTADDWKLNLRGTAVRLRTVNQSISFPRNFEACLRMMARRKSFSAEDLAQSLAHLESDNDAQQNMNLPDILKLLDVMREKNIVIVRPPE
jgi:predicted DNA-binding ribbon-helix-helix protein